MDEAAGVPESEAIKALVTKRWPGDQGRLVAVKDRDECEIKKILTKGELAWNVRSKQNKREGKAEQLPSSYLDREVP